mgnify:CR=1 FL=1
MKSIFIAIQNETRNFDFRWHGLAWGVPLKTLVFGILVEKQNFVFWIRRIDNDDWQNWEVLELLIPPWFVIQNIRTHRVKPVLWNLRFMYDSSCVFDERKIKHVHRNAIIYIFVMFKVSAGGWTKIKTMWYAKRVYIYVLLISLMCLGGRRALEASLTMLLWS